jgi:uncharacterized membrane protein
MDSRLPKLVFVLMAVIAAVYFSSLYAKLPEVIATHFTANGTPGNWQPKSEFGRAFILVTVIPAVLVFGVPALIKVLPAQLVNLPNKQYWLNGDRAAETQEFLGAWFGWFGCAVYFMILLAMNYAAQANLHPGERPSSATMQWVVYAFAGFTVAWVLRLMARFARRPGSDAV